MPPSPAPSTRPPDDMRRSYVRVLVSWVAVLAALYVFQQYFAVR